MKEGREMQQNGKSHFQTQEKTRFDCFKLSRETLKKSGAEAAGKGIGNASWMLKNSEKIVEMHGAQDNWLKLKWVQGGRQVFLQDSERKQMKSGEL